MSNLVMWNMIVGFLIPNVIALIQQPKWTSQVRAGLTAAVCVVAGGGTAYFSDQFRPGDIIGSILIVGVAAITFYKGFWKPTGVATSIENATSKTPPTVEQVHPEDAPDRHRDEYGLTSNTVVLTVVAVIAVLCIIVMATRGF